MASNIVPTYACTINISGTSTATTGEATQAFSGSGANTVVQIATAARRCMDPSVAIVVKDGVGTVAAASYIIEPLYGKIRFQSYTPSGAITVDYNYFPLLPIAGAHTFNVKAEREKINVTQFSQGVTLAGEDFILGKKMSSGDFSTWENYVKDHGSGVTMKSVLEGSTPVMLDARLIASAISGTGTTPGFRCFAVVHGWKAGLSESGAVDHQGSWQGVKYGLLDNSNFAWGEDYA